MSVRLSNIFFSEMIRKRESLFRSHALLGIQGVSSCRHSITNPTTALFPITKSAPNTYCYLSYQAIYMKLNYEAENFISSSALVVLMDILKINPMNDGRSHVLVQNHSAWKLLIAR